MRQHSSMAVAGLCTPLPVKALSCYNSSHDGGRVAKIVQVRELKNQTTQLLRKVEEGDTFVVTRRGKPVATLKKFRAADIQGEHKHDTSLWDHLCAEIENRYPELKSEGRLSAEREFERLTRKAGKGLPFDTWQEAD